MISRQRALKLGTSSICNCHTLGVSGRRHFNASVYAMVEAKDISPSAGEDVDTIVKDTTELVNNGRWRLCNDGKGLERAFKFKTFKATWDFMNSVAAECKTQKHHPEWTNIYNRTHVRWTTHSPEGLSRKDIRMARLCDQVAAQAGELHVENGESKVEGPSWTAEAKDCCVKKS